MNQSERILEIVSRASAAETSEEFFSAITSEVCAALDADCGWTGVFDPVLRTITTVAVYEDGRLASNFTYRLEGTPCERVVSHQPCYIPEKAWERYPEDAWLKQEGIESYVGSPLWDRDGNAIGIQVVLSRRPFADPELAQKLLNAIASRTAAEFERSRREVALRQSEERFRSLFESAAIGMAVVDVNARPLATNAALQSMLGYSQDELHALTFSRFTHPEDVEKAAVLFRDLVAGGRDHYQLEKRYIRKDGSLMWGRQTGSVVRNAGEPVFIVNMIEDITDHQIAAERLAQVRRLEDQVRRGEEQAALGRAAATMAHEFNNVLMGIQPFATLLGRIPHTEKASMALEQIQRALTRGKHVAGEVLRYAGDDNGTRFERIDVCKCVAQIAPEIAALCVKGVRFDLEVPSREIPVIGNASQLQQVLVNLARNAIDAMPESGGSLSIRVESRTGRMVSSASAESAVILVADNGSGISPDLLQKIFEPLFTTKHGQGGTGLGLSVTRKIVEKHGGGITVESSPGHGTTFQLWLPVAFDDETGGADDERPVLAEEIG
ncbi:MAG TPA: ATP-binding protein [Thermoanaerobaculia bacterium]|nr:ATP-binding protein [Thermoanaerobaculia bacterium]